MFKLFAALTARSTAVGATSAPAGSSAAASKIVYHSRLPRLNNDIFIVSSAGGAATRLTRHRGADSIRRCRPTGAGLRSRATATATGGPTRTRTCT